MIEWIKKGLSDDVGAMDEARVAALLIVLSFIGNSIASIVMSPSHTFDPQQFGIGAGALAAGLGGWFKFRGSN